MPAPSRERHRSHALSIAIRVIAPALAQGVMQRVLWRSHEMLRGFVATIAVGFLLTASAARADRFSARIEKTRSGIRMHTFDPSAALQKVT